MHDYKFVNWVKKSAFSIASWHIIYLSKKFETLAIYFCWKRYSPHKENYQVPGMQNLGETLKILKLYLYNNLQEITYPVWSNNQGLNRTMNVSL